MTENLIANTRLVSQRIAATKFRFAKETLEWMGAMQAQDFNMSKWGIGLRSLKSTEENIDAAIDSGEIIRTHILRPTWHFVSANDINWMIELTAPRILAAQKSRNKQLELTEKIFKKSNSIIEKLVRDGRHATRKEIVSALNKAKIETGNNRASHILFTAELQGIICSGRMNEKQITYALLSERVPKPKSLYRDEALARLAKKYFESHCPATLGDFTWWSGLSAADAKHALEMIKNDFISEKINSVEYWFPHSFSDLKKHKESVFLLPAFDEFLISYKNRSASVIAGHQGKVFSNNGIFWPTIVVNGQVAGIWKREIKKSKLVVSINFFDESNKIPNELLQKAAEKLGRFLGHETEMIRK
jgi:hypothetical protein